MYRRGDNVRLTVAHGTQCPSIHPSNMVEYLKPAAAGHRCVFIAWILLLIPFTGNIQVVGYRSNRVQLDYNEHNHLRNFDQTIANYMRERRIPGASIAISKNGEFLLRKGYGRAGASRLVTPWSLFRIGSISKTLTATGILKLYEDGRLSLDAAVFGPDGVLAHYNISGEKADPRLADVTVKHLLQHTVGWDLRGIGDPLVYRGVGEVDGELANQDDIIDFMLNRPLRHRPGAAYSYSNFGYMVLGRVIENVTSQPYEMYTKYMLWAARIYSFKLGHTRRKDADRSEVEYYSTYPANRVKSIFPNEGRLVEPPYGGFCLENMDSAAGWISSAADLLKLLHALDRNSWKSIFNHDTFAQMVAPPDYLHGRTWYGMGLLVKDQGNTWWHTGSLEGSTAVVTHDDSGFAWSALVNYQLKPNDLNDLLKYAIRGVPQWSMNSNNSTTHSKESKVYPLVADSVTANGRDIVKIMIPEHKFRYIFSSIATKGYRLTWIDAYDVFGTVHFNTIWTKNDGRKWKAYVGVTSSKYRRVFKSKTNRGYRLSHIETYVSRRRLRYAAIFMRDTWPGWVTYHGYSPHRHQAEFYKLLEHGYRLVVQSVTDYKGKLFITAIYDQVSVGTFRVRLGLNVEQYKDEMQLQLRRGRTLSYVQTYEHQGVPKFSAIFTPVTSSMWATGQDMTKYALLNRLHEYGEVNVPLQCVTSYHDGDLVRFTALWK